MSSLAKMFRERIDGAFNAAEAIEAKVGTVIPQLQGIVPIIGKSSIKQDAVIATLVEVTQLARDVKSDLEASGAHLAEETELLQEIKDEMTEHRHDMAHVATFARGLGVFLQDPVYLREIIELAGPEVVRGILDDIENSPKS